MSYNSRYHSDQENATRETSYKKLKSPLTQEPLSGSLSDVSSNKAKAQPIGPGAKRGLRQPLRGKDQNRTIAPLQRSKSSLNSSGQDTKVRRVPLSNKPSLFKANSSLGFTPKADSFTKSSNIDINSLSSNGRIKKPHANELKGLTLQEVNNDVFEKNEPSRPKVLVEPNSTDSLIKNDAPINNYEPIHSLSSTISPRTKVLGSSNLINSTQSILNVDPIKRSPRKSPRRSPRKSPRKQIFKNIIPEGSKTDIKSNPLCIPKDFPEFDEIEYAPNKEPELPYVPEGIEPLTMEDLQLISRKNVGNNINNDDEDILNLDDELDDAMEITSSNIEPCKVSEIDNELLDCENLGLQLDDLSDMLEI